MSCRPPLRPCRVAALLKHHSCSQTLRFESKNMCSHKKKRMKQIKKMAQRGLLDAENEDPFSLFVASTSIRYCYYSDTHKILGSTFGMCVLQVCHTQALQVHVLGNCITGLNYCHTRNGQASKYSHTQFCRILRVSHPTCLQEPLKLSRVEVSLSCS